MSVDHVVQLGRRCEKDDVTGNLRYKNVYILLENDSVAKLGDSFGRESVVPVPKTERDMPVPVGRNIPKTCCSLDDVALQSHLDEDAVD